MVKRFYDGYGLGLWDRYRSRRSIARSCCGNLPYDGECRVVDEPDYQAIFGHGEITMEPIEKVVVHKHIGEIEGIILELSKYPDDIPSERDMSYMKDDKARELYEELGDYLGEGEEDDE